MSTEKNIALEFNEFSKNYTNDMIACVPCYSELISGFTKYLPDNFNASNILDLGCGNGNITMQLLSRFPAANYTLVDASTQMIELCRNLFRENKVSYVNKYFNEFEFEKEAYDLVVAGFSLHHCEDNEKKSMFRKIYSSLIQGGIFSYSDLMISKEDPYHPLMLKEWKEFVHKTFPDGEKWNWIMEHYEVFDRPSDYQQQIKWIKEAGFLDIQTPIKKDYWVYLQALK